MQTRNGYKMRENVEYHLQCWLHTWLTINHIRHNASMSGGINLGPRVGAAKKRMGCQPGFPDIFLPYKHEGYSGLFIELKVAGGKVTKEQEEWRDFLFKAGYLVIIMPCDLEYGKGQDYLEEIVKNYMGLK